MAQKVRVVMIKTSLPTVEEARAMLSAEIDKAKSSGVLVLKVVHGYGASGLGGSLRHAIRGSLRKRRKEGKIRSFVTGEAWANSDPAAGELLNACPELRNDRDLNAYNEGITFVLL